MHTKVGFENETCRYTDCGTFRIGQIEILRSLEHGSSDSHQFLEMSTLYMNYKNYSHRYILS